MQRASCMCERTERNRGILDNHRVVIERRHGKWPEIFLRQRVHDRLQHFHDKRFAMVACAERLDLGGERISASPGNMGEVAFRAKRFENAHDAAWRDCAFVADPSHRDQFEPVSALQHSERSLYQAQIRVTASLRKAGRLFVCFRCLNVRDGHGRPAYVTCRFSTMLISGSQPSPGPVGTVVRPAATTGMAGNGVSSRSM